MFGPQAVGGAKALIKTAVLGARRCTCREHGLMPTLVGSGVAAAARLSTATVGEPGAHPHARACARRPGHGGRRLRRRSPKRINKQLRMSKQEIKEEHKQSEGDPQLKGAIRRGRWR